MERCQWLREGDTYIGWVTADQLTLIREAAVDLRDTAGKQLANTEPDIMTVSRDGVITDLMMERAHDQFDIPRDPHTMVEGWRARIIMQMMARDAHTVLTLTLGCPNYILIGPEPELGESFLWFAGDMWIAHDRYAKYLAETEEERDRYVALSEWFMDMGASLHHLASARTADPAS